VDAATIITNTINQIGTDASRATVLSLLNEVYAEQVVTSRWFRTEASIATTTAGTDTYSLPAAIVEGYYLKVGSYIYEAIGEDAMWRVKAATSTVSSGRFGWFSQGYDSTGSAVVTLYPTPSTTGDTILVYAARIPSDLTDSGASTPITPSDTHSSLIDGTAAKILERIDERPDLAVTFRARFDTVTEKLRRRKNALMRGGTPTSMLVAGIHF
jgi:hypothetical protein